jgi:hypothetical protein
VNCNYYFHRPEQDFVFIVAGVNALMFVGTLSDSAQKMEKQLKVSMAHLKKVKSG